MSTEHKAWEFQAAVWKLKQVPLKAKSALHPFPFNKKEIVSGNQSPGTATKGTTLVDGETENQETLGGVKTNSGWSFRIYLPVQLILFFSGLLQPPLGFAQGNNRNIVKS